jgi:hypothetical protein
MADINFDCPFCGQNLDAPEELAGLRIDCPACQKSIAIPAPAAPAAGPSSTGPIPDDLMSESLKKSSTMRLNLPPDLGIPPPSKRIVRIKRLGK